MLPTALRRPLVIGVSALALAAAGLALKWAAVGPFAPSGGTRDELLQNVPAQEVDVSDAAYAFTWPARTKTDRLPAAPDLALRIEPTDVYGWASGDDKARVLRVRGTPEALPIELLLPSADAFAPTPGDEVCEATGDPFAECRAGRARLVLHRDDDGRGLLDILLWRQALHDGGPLRPREFWTQEDPASGRIEFLGWVCGEGVEKADRALFGPPARASATTRNEKCLASTWQQKLASNLAGPDQQRLLLSCPANGPCEMHFLFDQRLVSIEAEELPAADTGEMRARLFFAAWETLNRIRRNGLKPPAALAELAEAKAQQAVCRAVSKEAFRWADALRPPEDAAPAAKGERGQREAWQKRWTSLSQSCLRAADIARRLSRVAPAEAEPILLAVMQARIALGAHDPDRQRNFDALFAMLTSNGKDQSPAMLTALAMYLGYAANVVREPGPALDARLAQVVQARWLLAQYGAELHDVDRAQLVEQLVAQYRAVGRFEDEVATYRQAIVFLEGRYGGNDQRLLEPLCGFSHALWRAGDAIEAVRTADRARRMWLTQAAAIRSGDVSARKVADWTEYGVGLAEVYRDYAFRQQEFHLTRPPLAEIADGLEQRLGPRHPSVAKVRRFAEEVLTRREAA